ncbi:hypothetical protein LTR12_001341 [Friedmanniomyces endolithicus]|nr:hypothetical protein LTR74_001491 [Friedmanniomyces endolithicus]KAK1824275.1 hypothetical protein LTR12_001341 [Friedmanniomyces endolithicus]
MPARDGPHHQLWGRWFRLVLLAHRNLLPSTGDSSVPVDVAERWAMDPLSISASAVALITICVQSVKIIKNVIETVRTAKKELLKILNGTNRMRLLLDQLRGLTHQLGSKNNKILLAFDPSGCEDILGQLKRLVDKLAKVETFMGCQFLVRRSKFEELVASLKNQEEDIRLVLLSVATANVQAISISQVPQTVAGAEDLPSPPYAETLASTEKSFKDTVPPDLISTEKPRMVQDASTKQDMMFLAEMDPPSTKAADVQANKAVSGLPSQSLNDQESTLWLPQAPANAKDIRSRTATISTMPALTNILFKLAIWHGQLSRDVYDAEYLMLRDSLADAAYYGDWTNVVEVLDNAHHLGLRSSPNCHRISGSRQCSGWTPLHQAVFLSAPEPVVRTLVEQGASRLLQTMWTSSSELPYRNMTALEMAQVLGYRNLFSALSPVIHHAIPSSVLQALQRHFHSLIESDIALLPQQYSLRLPELELLTELENPEMYFPLKSPKTKMGYIYRLDGRNLVVMSLGISSSEELKYFRITEQDVQELQDAIFFDTS